MPFLVIFFMVRLFFAFRMSNCQVCRDLWCLGEPDLDITIPGWIFGDFFSCCQHFCFSIMVYKEPDLNNHSWLDVPELQPHEWRQIVVLVVVRVIITREALKKLLSPNSGQNNETFFIHKIEGQTCHGL